MWDLHRPTKPIQNLTILRVRTSFIESLCFRLTIEFDKRNSHNFYSSQENLSFHIETIIIYILKIENFWCRFRASKRRTELQKCSLSFARSNSGNNLTKQLQSGDNSKLIWNREFEDDFSQWRIENYESIRCVAVTKSGNR